MANGLVRKKTDPKFYFAVFIRKHHGNYNGGIGIIIPHLNVLFQITKFSGMAKEATGEHFFSNAYEKIYEPSYSNLRIVRYSRFSDLVEAHSELEHPVFQEIFERRLHEITNCRIDDRGVFRVVDNDPTAETDFGLINVRMKHYFKKMKSGWPVE
ncbi:hypothetical protein HUK45_08820 [Limosilactobacillus sp. c9Ua_26_M]|uniref:Uncharacterized protein n=1 Tax=Limosilactobacillus urinaemulieris TaxID=2742600 RepID=A0ABR8ZLX9_9LACO|nr:hypothetical protein [Limosilactobacillus urinaemulieris]MBD8086319.1 hypothetical protein [Limosilactobacillus urinaemulieris]